MYAINRFVVLRDDSSYAVDVWTVAGSSYRAQAQQLYVEEYRIGVCSNANTETIAVNEAVNALIEKHM